MRTFARVFIVAGLVAGSLAGFVVVSGHARADEGTISQDQLRDGWDPNEPALSPATVGGGTFGQLFSTAVNGQVYAQPLVIGSSLVVATENDNVYSMNAQTGAINWSLSLGPAWPSSAVGCADLTPSIGITSTPVYDPATGTVYLTAVVNDGPNLYTPSVYLVAINAQQGTVEWKTPVKGAPVNDPSRPFDPLTERQRASLLLLGGEVYMAFGSYCDYSPYVGYVAGVNTATRSLTMWTTESGVTDNQAGIWMSGNGLMSDGPGRIFAATGNGVSPAAGKGTSPPAELGDSVVRLGVQPDSSLAAQDFFSPANAPTLDVQDRDLGSGGPVGLPFGTATYPHLLVQAGKDGRIFVLNRDALGGREQGAGGADNPVYVTPTAYNGQWGHPAAFAGSGGNDYIYYVGSHDNLRALKFNGTTNPARPVLTDVANSPATFGGGSGSPVVTSNGTDPASAVVWEVYSSSDTGSGGTLEAFDAVSSGSQLKMIWSAPIGTASKFAVPATDGGRVYAGTRDGHVLGFGSPDTAPLSGSPVSFGQVAVGGSPATATVNVKAKTPVTVTGVTASSASAPDPFVAGPPAEDGAPVSFPVTLAAGATLSVPVTFTPAGPGGATGALSLATDTPNFAAVSVSLSGDGTKPGFYASPPSLQFGTVATGTSGALQTVITNGGTAAESVTSTSAPGGPFSATGLPAGGTSIPAGGSVTVTVGYRPAAAQNDTGSLSVTGPDGTATVSLSGTGAAGQGTLSATPPSVGFGTVPLGQQATQSIDVSNTGNLPMTITGFRAPAVPFGTPDPVSGGITLDPGYDLQIPVTFTPQSQSTSSGTYTLTASDGHNPAQSLTIGVSGSGAAPSAGVAVPSPGGGWTLNGSAQMSGTTLRLTRAVNGQSGSAVYYQPLASNGLHAQFTSSIGGGNGADGMTFSLLDATKAAPSSLGGGGGLLGFGRLPGVAVTLDTYRDAGYPSANFIGIATGSSATGLTFAATSTAVPNLRGGSHHIGVTVTGSAIAVTVDGKQYLSARVTLPPTVLAAFTGGTGGLNDAHAVSGVSVSSGGTVLPAPGGGWSYNGSAVMAGSETRLTQAANGQAGSVVYPATVATNGLKAQFSMRIGGGSGADGMTFALLNPGSPATARGSGGSGLGFAGLSGVAVAFDTHQATGYPSSNFAGIATGASSTGVLKFVQTVKEIGQLRTGTHDVGISVSGGVLTVFFDGAQILQQRVSLASTALLAFTGGTGGLNDVHAVSDAAISAGSFAKAAALAPASTLPPGVPGNVPAGTVPLPTVEVATSQVYGPVLVTPAGVTLYRQTGTCSCDGQYRPLVAGPGQSPVLPPLLHGQLSTVTLPDGSQQIAFDGWPLYVYAGDHAAGDTNGVNLSWQVIKPVR
jgi:predicted lipoprotein with Yx(FWY)xxD motif